MGERVSWEAWEQLFASAGWVVSLLGTSVHICFALRLHTSSSWFSCKCCMGFVYFSSLPSEVQVFQQQVPCGLQHRTPGNSWLLSFWLPSTACLMWFPEGLNRVPRCSFCHQQTCCLFSPPLTPFNLFLPFMELNSCLGFFVLFFKFCFDFDFIFFLFLSLPHTWPTSVLNQLESALLFQ